MESGKIVMSEAASLLIADIMSIDRRQVISVSVNLRHGQGVFGRLRPKEHMFKSFVEEKEGVKS